MKVRVTIALCVLLAIVIAATEGRQHSLGFAASPTPASSGVVREVLVEATPNAAPGEALQLVRYVIDAGTILPQHVHPGTQIATIESGDLTYFVVSGEIHVKRAAANGTPGPDEILTSGQQTVLHPGDSVIETEGMVHYGANYGDTPVIILAATLLTAGQPASIANPTPTP